MVKVYGSSNVPFRIASAPALPLVTSSEHTLPVKKRMFEFTFAGSATQEPNVSVHAQRAKQASHGTGMPNICPTCTCSWVHKLRFRDILCFLVVVWLFVTLGFAYRVFNVVRQGAAPITDQVSVTLGRANSLLGGADRAAVSLDEIMNVTVIAARNAVPAADHIVSVLNETVGLVDRVHRLVRHPTLKVSMEPDPL